MRDFGVTKTFVKLTVDYSFDSSEYPEENCFLPTGTEGVILTIGTLDLIPNLSEEKRIEILNRMHDSVHNNSLLLLICGKVISVPVWMWEEERCEGGRRFEDAKDFADYLEKMIERSENASSP